MNEKTIDQFFNNMLFGTIENKALDDLTGWFVLGNDSERLLLRQYLDFESGIRKLRDHMKAFPDGDINLDTFENQVNEDLTIIKERTKIFADGLNAYTKVRKRLSKDITDIAKNLSEFVNKFDSYSVKFQENVKKDIDKKKEAEKQARLEEEERKAGEEQIRLEKVRKEEEQKRIEQEKIDEWNNTPDEEKINTVIGAACNHFLISNFIYGSASKDIKEQMAELADDTNRFTTEAFKNSKFNSGRVNDRIDDILKTLKSETGMFFMDLDDRYKPYAEKITHDMIFNKMVELQEKFISENQDAYNQAKAEIENERAEKERQIEETRRQEELERQRQRDEENRRIEEEIRQREEEKRKAEEEKQRQKEEAARKEQEEKRLAEEAEANRWNALSKEQKIAEITDAIFKDSRYDWHLYGDWHASKEDAIKWLADDENLLNEKNAARPGTMASQAKSSIEFDLNSFKKGMRVYFLTEPQKAFINELTVDIVFNKLKEKQEQFIKENLEAYQKERAVLEKIKEEKLQEELKQARLEEEKRKAEEDAIREQERIEEEEEEREEQRLREEEKIQHEEENVQEEQNPQKEPKKEEKIQEAAQEQKQEIKEEQKPEIKEEQKPEIKEEQKPQEEQKPEVKEDPKKEEVIQEIKPEEPKHEKIAKADELRENLRNDSYEIGSRLEKLQDAIKNKSKENGIEAGVMESLGKKVEAFRYAENYYQGLKSLRDTVSDVYAAKPIDKRSIGGLYIFEHLTEKAALIGKEDKTYLELIAEGADVYNLADEVGGSETLKEYVGTQKGVDTFEEQGYFFVKRDDYKNKWDQATTEFEKKANDLLDKQIEDIRKAAELKAQQEAEELKERQKAEELRAQQEAEELKAQQKAAELKAEELKAQQNKKQKIDEKKAELLGNNGKETMEAAIVKKIAEYERVQQEYNFGQLVKDLFRDANVVSFAKNGGQQYEIMASIGDDEKWGYAATDMGFKTVFLLDRVIRERRENNGQPGKLEKYIEENDISYSYQLDEYLEQDPEYQNIVSNGDSADLAKMITGGSFGLAPANVLEDEKVEPEKHDEEQKPEEIPQEEQNLQEEQNKEENKEEIPIEQNPQEEIKQEDHIEQNLQEEQNKEENKEEIPIEQKPQGEINEEIPEKQEENLNIEEIPEKQNEIPNPEEIPEKNNEPKVDAIQNEEAPKQDNIINELQPEEQKKYRDEIKRLTARIIKTEKTKQTNTGGYWTLKEELQKSAKQDDIGEVFKGLVIGANAYMKAHAKDQKLLFNTLGTARKERIKTCARILIMNRLANNGISYESKMGRMTMLACKLVCAEQLAKGFEGFRELCAPNAIRLAVATKMKSRDFKLAAATLFNKAGEAKKQYGELEKLRGDKCLKVFNKLVEITKKNAPQDAHEVNNNNIQLNI